MSRGAGLVLLLALTACGAGERASVQLVGPQDECAGRADRVLCSAGRALRCVGGKIDSTVACVAPQQCIDNVGCRLCSPAAVSCDGSKRYKCDPDGSTLTLQEECAPGLSCSPTGCFDLCAEAAANRSYLGCDYYPVFTSNSQLDPSFLPAVGIGNGNLVPAHVVITKDQTTIAELSVAPNSAQTVMLTFDAALKNSGGSRLVRQGAYHLQASVPVTVHQYNPLLYQLPQACSKSTSSEQQSSADVCNSFTNDASLLYPASALRQDPEQRTGAFLEFVALSRSAFLGQNVGASDFGGLPGFVAVVAVGTAPTKVTVKSSAFTLASPVFSEAAGPDGGIVESDAGVAGSDSIPAMQPGDALERVLTPGDVLQLVSQIPSLCSGLVSNVGTTNFCDPGAQFDMTGTLISADGPVEVISGHDCSNVPFDRPACDHLEESMPPLHAWGNNAITTVPQVAAGAQYLLRVLSGDDANTVTFDPPVHEPVTLAKYQMLELSTTLSTLIQGTGRLLVGQYLVGEGTTSARVGDPSLSIAVPVEQYLSHYNFISPATYERNYVDIIALANDVVTLDGQLISTFTPVGKSGFSVASVVLLSAGAHEIHAVSQSGIGIVLYGIAPFTSYMLPGGLDLTPIGPIGI